MILDGTIVGYDPGGNDSHGLVFAQFREGELENISLGTYGTADLVIKAISGCSDIIAIGIDTLTCWSTGRSGWRPADRWLKKKYPKITNSITSAKSLYGSMGLNGMSVLIASRSQFPTLYISETHPKVLYFELIGKKYDYKNDQAQMDDFLTKTLGSKIQTKNDHEWDAAISAFAVRCGLEGLWSKDLHRLEVDLNERLITPCGATHYWWP